jgi:Uma2 family endonuclease
MHEFAKQVYTLEEYFEIDKNSEEKFEFFEGNVWCMSGASPVHERIVSNSIFQFRTVLKDGCSVFASNLRVKVPAYGPYRYPDMTVYCGEGEFEKMGGLDVLTNPQMIIEILSPSTEGFDRGAKFTYYKSIPSLTDYLLIATQIPHVVNYTKQGENEWVQREAVGLDAKLILPTFQIELLLSEIYRDIEFPEIEEEVLTIVR